MKDVFFNDYKKNGSPRRPNGELNEQELEERLNRRRFDEIMENQRRSAEFYPDGGAPEHVRGSESYPYEQPEAPEEPTKKKKKKKRGCGCGCGSAFLCFILIIALIAGGSLGYLWILCGKPQYTEPVENRYISESSLDYNTLVKNYLLIGSDKDSENTSRSDTMMLVSIDTAHNTVKFTSFMRDMWVQIPDHGEAKLNASYAYGGAALVKDTIEYNFHIRIDGYFTVDFEIFKKLIDALGGVTVDITEQEAEFINRTTHARVTPGLNTLDGDYALIYCRIRKLDSDFMRTERQRKVMKAIMQKVVSQNIFKTISAGSEILPMINTDVSQGRLFSLAVFSPAMIKYGNDQLRIPAEDAYTSGTIQYQSVLIPDMDKNREVLHQFIYE